jgi:ribosomal protein L37AE/L43A
MKNDSLRGSRLGSHSLESDRGIEYSARKQVDYSCTSCNAITSLTFAQEAESPYDWECGQCGELATLVGATAPMLETIKPVKEAKTPFEMLLERRSRTELEEILNERLVHLRQRRGAGLEDLAG